MTAKTPDGKCVCGSWLGDYDQCLAGCDGSGSDPTPSGCGYDESTNPSNGWRAPEGSATPEEIRDADGFLVLYDMDGSRPDFAGTRKAAEALVRRCREETSGNVEARIVRAADAWDLSRTTLDEYRGALIRALANEGIDGCCLPTLSVCHCWRCEARRLLGDNPTAPLRKDVVGLVELPDGRSVWSLAESRS